jgi:hypothetical protein
MSDDAHQSTFGLIYFIVWATLATGTIILYRGHRDAEFRIRWHARISLISGLTVLAFMFLIFPSWGMLVFICGFGGLIIYLSISKTTICKNCGKIIQPIGLFDRAKHCPHCGGETARSKIFNA